MLTYWDTFKVQLSFGIISKKLRNLIVRQNENRNLSVLKISYSETIEIIGLPTISLNTSYIAPYTICELDFKSGSKFRQFS